MEWHSAQCALSKILARFFILIFILRMNHQITLLCVFCFYRFVLGVVPLNLEQDKLVFRLHYRRKRRKIFNIVFSISSENYEFPRSWLLPVMRDHVCETEMMYFFEELLPLANKLMSKG